MVDLQSINSRVGCPRISGGYRRLLFGVPAERAGALEVNAVAGSVLSNEDERRGIALARRQPGAARELTELFERVRVRALRVAEADDVVRERLSQGRVRLLGADYDEDKPDERGRPRRLGRLYFYDYDRGTAVVVSVDLRGGHVVGLAERRGVHLRPSDEEIGQARELVLRSELGREFAGRQVSVVAFAGRTVDEDDPTWSHRRLELHLWSTEPPPRRLVSAVVDLTDGRVQRYDEDREG